MVHIDIWGPYQTPSSSGVHFFLTLVDDCTRTVWTYLLKHKNEACHVFQNFYSLIQTQFGFQIKQVRSDNALELTEGDMKLFFRNKGIVNQTSYAGTPQQNGVVKRKHRGILNMARALRFQSNLPIKFWGECVLIATYILNRLPHQHLEVKPLLKRFLASHQHIIILEYLVVCVMLLILYNFWTSSNPGQGHVCL